MHKAVRLADIADELGISIVTVSKALSGQKGVSEDLRKKILDVADERGYRNQPVGGRKNGSLAEEYNFVVFMHEKYMDSRDSFYIKLYQEITAKALSLGLLVTLQIITEAMEKTLDVSELEYISSYDGIIFMGKFRNEYYEKIVEMFEIPMINLDFYDEKVDIDSVISDNFYGAYRLTKYLFDKGHTKIAYVGMIEATDSIIDRFMGYSKALLCHGRNVKTDWVVADRYGAMGSRRLREFRLPKEMPTAFFCNNDMTAGYLINQLEANGFRVPEDISVVGYDNFLYSGMCDVEITTYEVDLKEMACASVDLLFKKIKDSDYKSGLIIIPGRLVEKNSVKEVG